MTAFTIATFNVQNLIGPDQEFYRFQEYSSEEYRHKERWLATQLTRMNSDIVAFQEIFEPEPLQQVIARADEIAQDPETPPGARAWAPYGQAALAFAPNIADSGPGERRPGLAVLSRFGFAEEPQSIQVLDPPIDIPFHHLGGGDAGHYQLARLSRPILRLRIPVGDHVITVLNAHLKSPLGEFIRPHGARHSPEIEMLNYDAAGRAMGALRAALRRMAEAWVLRKLALDELDRGHPVIVLGDLNDNTHSMTQAILSGEAPFPDYTWLTRPDAESAADVYTPEEAAQIREAVERVRLHSAEQLFIRQSLRDMVHTTGFGGVYQSLDAILLSRHFHPDWPERIAEMTHLSLFNDHVTDGTCPEAPGNRLVSDHGQLVAHLRLR
ncbi:endonuclease/exonuclease/phosphatase family protein [Rhodovulum adriaticum]|uniref:Endonuclease/exonuclease/phosphatase family protein n=1 Tax=Rhodovulum adriaticum TaxID=35804 RepID=A0A4R2NLY2_RHOAD|nr:endonuclease/exonuclease/phosphatase family protein [Rhodovulum adriaticum]MBK1635192.1 alpha-1,4 polygalactosaminidase [Rhodovulum adriaticum]TCP22305.1 endonuclease/exonuclease/phosphatase family protein [Rhodovulum adriaticum]